MIGVFDSGVGGLTVLSHFLKDHPKYNYVYLGDNANVPYGNKSPEMIYGYSKKAVDFLYSKGCRLIIFACNSASAQALRRIQQEYLPEKYQDLKVLGVIRPIAEKISSLKNVSRVGIIGTKATIKSNTYNEEIRILSSDIEIFSQATPLLVPLIEENWIKKPETKMILRKYLRPLKNKKVQALVLACTHYPFLLKSIISVMGPSCLVFDPGKVVSDSLGNYLERHPDIEIKLTSKNNKIKKVLAIDNCLFYATDDLDNFKKLGDFFLGRKIRSVKKVNLS